MADSVQKVDALRVGEALEQDIYDPSGLLLLREGVIVTMSFIERLKARGIRIVSTSADGIEETDTPASTKPTKAARPSGRSPAAGPRNPRGKAGGDAHGRSGTDADAPAHAGPVLHRVDTPDRFAGLPGSGVSDPQAYQIRAGGGEDLPQLSAEQFGAASDQAERMVASAFERWDELGGTLTRGGRIEMEQAGALLGGMVPMLRLDRDVIGVMLHMHADHLKGFVRHGVRVALMAMHLAHRVGYDEPSCLDAGVVGLLADVGMSRVPAEIVDATRPLTADEWLHIHRHPGYSADLIEQAHGLRPDIAIAVYQHHERLDGSGYPHGRGGMFLHPLARIAAVADTFAAVSDDRAHRRARGGHFAVKAVLEGVQQGKLDRVVAKALIDSVSLFPLGTKLTLSDGRRGTVYRTHPQHADRPLLTLLDENDTPTKRKLDLAVADDLKVASVDDPALNQAA